MAYADKLKPDGYKVNIADLNPPAANLELEHIYGFRCHDTRNNLKFTTNQEVLYTAASVAIILDLKTNKQRFYNEHTDDICCMDIYAPNSLVATG